MTLRSVLVGVVVVGMAAGIGLLLMGLNISPDRQQPYRCFEQVNLNQLIKAEGSPQLARSGWGTSGMNTSIENRLFDGRQEAELPVDSIVAVDRLCRKLREQLAARCEVKEFWAGTEYCAGVFESSSHAVTSPDGTYMLRPVIGRMDLLTSRLPDGRLKVVLMTTEWKN